MKQIWIKMATGATLALAVAVVAGGGSASASSGYVASQEHGNNYYARYDSDNNNSYYHNHNHNYGRGSGYSTQYNRGNSDNGCAYGCGGGGMWWQNRWYAYSQMGYWNQYNSWVSYRSDWGDNDWQSWHRQHCD